MCGNRTHRKDLRQVRSCLRVSVRVRAARKLGTASRKKTSRAGLYGTSSHGIHEALPRASPRFPRSARPVLTALRSSMRTLSSGEPSAELVRRLLAPTRPREPRGLPGVVVPAARPASAEGEGGAAGGPAGWQLEWVREPPLPPPLPPPPPPGPFAAERGERGGAAGAAMEPDSVIEDKTIELMVSAARWPSVLPAGRRPGGLPTSASAPG